MENKVTMYMGETSPVGNGTWPDNGETDIEEVSSDRPDRPGMERQTSTNSFAGRLSKRGSEIALVIKGKAGLAVLGPYVQNGEDLFDGDIGSDPVLDTIRQLKPEDQTDRDLCCGFLAQARNLFKALWMFFSVIIIWAGFIGLDLCPRAPQFGIYLAVEGLFYLLFLAFGELAGNIAIWKGRRYGVLLVLLWQLSLGGWLIYGYMTFIVRIVQKTLAEGSDATMSVNSTESLNMTAVPATAAPAGQCNVEGCTCNYFYFVLTVFVFTHVVILTILFYSTITCPCAACAQAKRRKYKLQTIQEEDIERVTDQVNRPKFKCKHSVTPCNIQTT